MKQTVSLTMAIGSIAIACSSSSSSGPGATAPTDSGTGSEGGASDGGGGSVACTASANAIAGTTPEGTPFASVVSAYFIGKPDSAATTVVFLFSKQVACADIVAPGWDTRIPDKTQVLEIKMLGTKAPASFTVTNSLTPAPGESTVPYTLSSMTGTPSETFASGGSVDLATRVDATTASGCFAIDYPQARKLTGTFTATYCAGGVEP